MTSNKRKLNVEIEKESQMLKRKYCAYYLFPVPIGIVTMGRDCLCGTGRLTGLLAIPKI
jgi:hypothetical protein